MRKCRHPVLRLTVALFGVLSPFSSSSLQAQTPELIWQQQQNSDRINAVVFSSDGNTFITGSSDRLINFWRASDGTLLRILNTNAPAVHESSIESLAVTSDGNYLASASFQVVKLWNLSAGTVQVLNAGTNWNVGVAFSPGGTYLAGASFDTKIRIWRVADGALIKTLTGHQNVARCVSFSPDGSLLATAAGDATVRIYRTSDWSLVRVLLGHTSDIYDIAFSPNGQLIATGSYDQTARLWNVSDGSLRAILPGNGNVYAVGFNSDSTLLAYADGEANSLRLVRTSDGAEVKRYTEQVNNVQALAFSPNGGGVLGYGRADATVVMSRVSASTTVPPVTQPPQITLSAPQEGANYFAPARISLSATASAGAGVQIVEFFQNGASLGSDAAAPYSMVWDNVPVGNYSLTAVVTDRLGRTATSPPVNITVSTAPPETSRPTVAISSPAAGARLTSTPVIISGTASDNVAVAQVLYSLNGSSFQAATGTSAWQATGNPVPGLNTVQVKSVDTAGNESAVVSRTFSFVVTSTLNLSIAGSGQVAPNLNGRSLEVGRNYVVTAVPAPGFVFDGWSGGSPNPSANLRFTMQENLALQANFIPNPFLPVLGNYRGLIFSDANRFAGSGYFRLALNPSGTFAARIIFGTRDFQFAGRFNNHGHYTAAVRTSAADVLNIDLQLAVGDNSGRITGTVIDGTNSGSLLAMKPFYSGQNPAPQVGRYTFLIPPTGADGTPAGFGFGVALIDRVGNVIINGTLGDGSPFTASAAIGSDGSFPLYIQLYNGSGALLGFINARPLDSTDLDGTLNWFRPATAVARYFRDGFVTQVSLAGSRYSPPAAGTRVLNYTASTGNALIRLGAGNLDVELDKTGTLATNNRLTIDQPGEDRLNVILSPGNGLFSGTFIHPTLHRAVGFRGAILQKQNRGVGFFLGNDQGGFVRIEPVQ